MNGKGNKAPKISNRPSQTRLAYDDIVEGLRSWRVWGYLGWHDIRQRYRRSKIGPFWITISMGAMTGSLGFVYAHLFGIEMSSYLPFLTLGFVLWGFISTLVLEGASAFIEARAIIRETKLALSTHVLRVAWRTLIIFFHNIIIFLVVIAIYNTPLSWTALLALPGLMLVYANGVLAGLVVGALSARYRDIPLILASVMQLLFFVTPIIWRPDQRPGLELLLALNPFFHMIDVVRAPLLGELPRTESWVGVTGLLIVGGVVAFLGFRRLRGRIAYWV